MILSKNTLTRSLMSGSILLVLVLQGFWLKSSYEDALGSFRQEAGFLFRSTVMNLQDSLIRENIEQVPGDSLFAQLAHPAERPPDSPGDLVFAKSFLPERIQDSSGMAIMITTTDREGFDSKAETFLSPEDPLSGFAKDRVTRYFILRRADSLSTKDIEAAYGYALAEAGITIPFKVVSIPIDTSKAARMRLPLPAVGRRIASGGAHSVYLGTGSRELHDEAELPPIAAAAGIRSSRGARWEQQLIPVSNEGNMLTVEHVFLPPSDAIVTAQFSRNSYRWLLIREIGPQLLFSVVMVLFISISFYFMYRSLKMQQRLMLLKNDFVSNMTHELKTPVATASVAIESLRNFHTLDNPARTGEYLEIAHHELNRLVLLTDNILKAAAFESKGIVIRVEKIEVKETISEVLASMKLVFEKRQAKVTFDTEGDDFLVEGGKAHIVNVFYNLLDNALKYSQPSPQIGIWLKSMADGILLCVRDNGMGIAPEFHKKVFEKFFRVPSGNVHNIKGHGLGLNYVAGVVKSHEGTIRLDSHPGKGSAFTIYLPRRYEKN